MAQVTSDIPTKNRYQALEEDDLEQDLEETSVPSIPVPLATGLPRMKKVSRKSWRKLDLGKDYGCGEDCCGKESEVHICPVENKNGQMSIKFQVADVVKPLISVKRLVEKGNCVTFGPGEKDNFIENRQSKCKVGLIPTAKGSYLLRVNFAGGSETDIVVDSGAEENVCPK